MAISRKNPIATIIAVAVFALTSSLFVSVHGTFDYKDALTKSMIFLEAQRSGKLPPNHRPAWREDSGLDDGKLVGVDLTGGYYDAGDNVKYGFPMAFTVTTLAWNAIFYKTELQAAGELATAEAGIRWGTDFFLKAAFYLNGCHFQVGDPVLDHQCWVRPEIMQTPRTVLVIDSNNPGTEIAAETAAAMASASMVFRTADKAYSRRLLKYITEEAIGANVNEFSWDLKYAGAQVLLSKLFFEGEASLANFKQQADSYICSVLPESPYHQVYLTPGGLIHLRDGANTQYVTGTAFLFVTYGDLLARYHQTVNCGGQQFDSTHLINFAKKQVDYLLGDNPLSRSYMVGFGQNPPMQPHHRGASVPSNAWKSLISCPLSFVYWYNKDVPNPNELTGAIVGGPDKTDNFNDKRWDSSMTEPCTYVNSLLVGPLAKFTAGSV